MTETQVSQVDQVAAVEEPRAQVSASDTKRRAMLRAVAARALAKDPEYRRYAENGVWSRASGVSDYTFAAAGDETAPAEVFNRLRWGGVFVFVAPDAASVRRVAETFDNKDGFVIDRAPAVVHDGPLGLPIPFLSRPVHYFAARKTHIIPPGSTTDRFTYDVQLVRRKPGEPYVVLKQIPDAQWIERRLVEKFPDTEVEVLRQRTRKLVDKVFPVFLTREVAFLNILQRDLPAPYNDRVPRVVDAEKDERGFVRKLYLNWLRFGTEPISQTDFAFQGADLLRQVHDKARVIHLDLRLDNIVISDNGVCFVDFGSAVRVGENLGESQMLSTLFEEMLFSSSIQRTLGRMKRSGRVTSRIIADSHQKIDKAVDLFFLALQMSRPHENPDLRDLVRYDPRSREANSLKRLTEGVLAPPDPENPPFRTAEDLFRAVEKIRRD